ncbi:MAG: leucine-rich repeat domain-containing protein [Muribaculaceae bacterium]|nr:leucine-rich repeat domain-containing protein [Muribaculaceae bacterium]
MLRHIFLLAGAAATLCASAATIDCTPGNAEALLGTAVGDKSLTLTGSADANDLLFIGSKMSALTDLDLSGLTIVASNGPKGNFPAATIPAGAFAGSGITTLALPEGVVVGDCAFAGTAITTLVLPAKATLGTGSFSACPSLTSVTIGASTTIGDHAFASCKALKNVNLGGATVIADYAFAACEALATVEGTQSLTAIGADAFNGCDDLTSFTFGPALKTIGDGAFRHSGIETADLKNTAVTSLGEWAFADCRALTGVEFPASCTVLGKGVFFDCPQLALISIPGNCEAIPAYAFKDDSSILNLPIADNVRTIGEYSLKGIGTAKLILPSSLDSIGSNAMEDVTVLNRIDASRLEAVPALGDDVWAGVEQSGVVVDVDSALVDDFKNATQWQDFTINPVNIVSVITTPDETASLRGAFTADRLLVESTVAVTELSVYDLSGMLLLHQTPDSCSIAVPADNFSNIIIVNCRLDGGATATLKLAR